MSLLANIQTGDVTRAISDNRELLDPVRQFILDNFGQNGLYAAYILAAAIVILLLYKLVKFSFELILVPFIYHFIILSPLLLLILLNLEYYLY